MNIVDNEARRIEADVLAFIAIARLKASHYTLPQIADISLRHYAAPRG